MSNNTTKHGHARRSGFSAEYIAWRNMIARCERPSSQRYSSYGARGIRVCERWRESFEAFLTDMGPKPSQSYSIDRVNVHGNYEPENCRWAPKKIQQRNTQRSRTVEFRGERMSLPDAVERAGLNYSMVKRRLQNGWTDERALTEPKRVWPEQRA
jgi:hypothetical protein